MLKRIVKYLLGGISWGCSFFVLTQLTGVLISGDAFLEPVAADFVRHALGAILCGVLCGSTAIVYTFDRLPWRAQIAIHFAVGISGYLAIAWHLKWIPAQTGIQIGISVFLAVFIFTAIWAGFYLYNRHEARTMNRKIRELEEQDS